MARIVRKATPASAVITTAFYAVGGSANQVGYGTTPNASAMTSQEWTPMMFQIQANSGLTRTATSLRLPSIKSVSEWFQYAAWSVSVGKGEHAGRSSQSGENFRCLEDPYYNPSRAHPTAGRQYFPAEGTVVAGDIVVSAGHTSSYIREWECTASGTSRIISTTADTTSGSDAVTFADSTVIVPGDYISIVGVSGTKRVLSVDYTAGTGVIDSNAGATVSGGAVANVDPTWEARLNSKVRTGTATPVSSIVPVAIGQEFYDTVGAKFYKAFGLTNADWVALN